MGNWSMISERSYRAPLQLEINDDDDDDASSTVSDEVMEDPFEASESSPIDEDEDEVGDDDSHLSSFFTLSSY